MPYPAPLAKFVQIATALAGDGHYVYALDALGFVYRLAPGSAVWEKLTVHRTDKS
jgi:VCBS repeat-containing protein